MPWRTFQRMYGKLRRRLCSCGDKNQVRRQFNDKIPRVANGFVRCQNCSAIICFTRKAYDAWQGRAE